jgi:Ca2+/H+ antiporter, TMEM165/GDT1 family
VTGSEWALAVAVFGASAVETVEALTIVLAAGTTRGWRSAIEGATVAVGVLTVLVVAVGVPLIRYVPIDALRVVVGALLLSLGLNWLRKAWLRASGHKALHDEDKIYAETVASLSDGAPARHQRDAVGFAVAFKGVFLEGTEVILIVISLGASQGRLGLAAAAAAAALLIVGVVGAIVARQLSSVPENAIKLAVGVMLTSFGLFWIGEGAGIRWPGSDAFLLVLVALFAALSAIVIPWLRRSSPAPAVSP